jgi:hypothetical protein
MALKAKLTKDEHAGLPEAVRALYTEKDGAFILEVEGLVDGKALESERSARAKAAREFQELKDKIGDLDPEKAREALRQVQALADKKLLDEGKVDELIQARTEAMRTDHKNQLAAFEGKIKEKDDAIGRLTQTVKTLRINSELTPLALKKGIRPEALQDVIARMTVLGIDGIKWDIDGDNVVAKIGDQIKYGKDPQKAMSFEEGLDLLATAAPHLFADSKGTGANGNKGGGGKSHTISQEEASDPAKYRAARDEARKAGVELQIQQ